jgi:predicted metalloprotease with PDZ domain
MTIRYAIRAADCAAHLFHVICRVERPDPDGQLFMLPAWIPGSYMIREFARNIVRISALAGKHKVPLHKLDKHTWRAAPVKGPLEVACEIYAWDLSVRAAHLDQTHGFFNGTSVFLMPIGLEHEACSVDILPPDGERYRAWRVATGLAPARGTHRHGFGTYLAADYDGLIDCPVEMGEFELGRFDVLGVPHEIAITGIVPRLDLGRLTADLARACETQIRLFEPRRPAPPFSNYTFLALAVGEGYGGLEHRNSTALITRRGDLPFVGMKDSTEGYRTFLGLASHEYFHSWNVKRIKPSAFVPYDLTQENPTRLLWAFEGFTSYYDDLMLARAGLLNEAQYLDSLARTLTTVMQRPSRLKQSLADSSFDAWIKYYRQDENAPNSVVSYYQKGALVGLALDLAIRAQTRGARSLDDVMRLLWQHWKDAGASYRGVAEDGIVAAAEEATGLKLAPLIAEWTEGTRDPDFAALFAPFGIECARRPAVDVAHFAMLGIKTAADGRDCRLAHVFDGSPAQKAGLSANDLLVALGGLRVTPDNLDKLLARYAAGDNVEVNAFRRDELMRFEVNLATEAPIRYALKVEQKETASARRLRSGWLTTGQIKAG